MYSNLENNVLIITKSARSIGGVEEVVDLHCRTFTEKNCSIKVLSIKNNKNKYSKTYKNILKAQIIEEKGIFSIRLGLLFFKKLIDNAKNSSILVFHQPFITGLLGLILIVLSKKIFLKRKHNLLKIYIYIHALPSRSILHRFIFSFILRIILKLNSEFIILISSFSRDNMLLLKNLKNKIEKVIIPVEIPSNIYENQIIQRDKKTIKKFLFIKEKFKDRNIAVFIGRICFYKGLVNLIKAYKDSKDFPILCIFGVGPFSKKIIKLLKLEKKSNIYFFNSYIEESTKFFIIQNSNIYFFTSITKGEAYGIAQLEALSCGIPVLNTNLGTGVNDICKDMIHGVTVENYSSKKSLTDSIHKINLLIKNSYFKKDKLQNYVKNNFSYYQYEKEFSESFFLKKN